MSIATMTSKGQVTIPKAIRDRLGLEKGDRLEFIARPDGTILVRRSETIDIRDLFGMFKATRHATIEEMNEAIRAGWAGE